MFKQFVYLNCLLFFLLVYGCLRLQFSDVEENPGPSTVPRDKCEIMFSNINGIHGNPEDLAVAASGLDFVVFSETKVYGCRHVTELLIPGFSFPTILLRGDRPNGLGLALYARSGLSVFRQCRFEWACCEFMVFKLSGRLLNFYLFFVYRNTSKDDRVYDCLSMAMGKMPKAWLPLIFPH